MFKVRVKDRDGFMGNVFGADCFASNFPEIFDTGVHVRYKKCGSSYVYSLFDNETQKDYHSSTFLTEAEMQFMECVDIPEQDFTVPESVKKELDEKYEEMVKLYDQFMKEHSHLFTPME